MTYWPGTKIVKSQGNAFDWKNQHSAILEDKEVKLSNASRVAMAGKGSDPRRTFTIYSKARPAK